MAKPYTNDISEVTASFPGAVFVPENRKNLLPDYLSITEPITVPAADGEGRCRVELDYQIRSAVDPVITIGGVVLTHVPYGEAVGASEVGINFSGVPILEFHASLAALVGNIVYAPLTSVRTASWENQIQAEIAAVQAVVDAGGGGGGGGGAVESVNGHFGEVVLDSDDVGTLSADAINTLVGTRVTYSNLADGLALKQDLLTYGAAGQMMVTNGTGDGYAWDDPADSGGASALVDLSDVNAPSPSNGESLTFDSVTGKWIPQSLAGLTGVNNKFVHAMMSANQTIPSSTLTVLAFDNVIENSDSMWDVSTDQYEIPSVINGKVVFFSVSVQHTVDASGTIELRIEKSEDGGSTWVKVGQSSSAGFDYFGISTAFVITRVATGDLVRHVCFYSSSKIISYIVPCTNITAVVLDTANGGTVGGVNPQTGTSYTLLVSDEESIVTMSSASANTLTIPANSSAAIAVGAKIEVVQTGAGVTTIQAGSGVTLRGVSEGSSALSGQWGRASLQKIATDLWTVNGDHGAVS